MEVSFSLILHLLRIFDFQSPPPHVESPEITLTYASYVDQYDCPVSQFLAGKKMTYLVDKSKAADLRGKLPSLQKVWDERGPQLLQEASRVLNSSFGYQRHETGVFYCETIPS